MKKPNHNHPQPQTKKQAPNKIKHPFLKDERICCLKCGGGSGQLSLEAVQADGYYQGSRQVVLQCDGFQEV
jgi:hypothetical protein